MDLLVSLAIVDEMQGGKRMRQLAHGWMGWEPKCGQRLRALGATALVALAARLDASAAHPQREGAALAPNSPA